MDKSQARYLKELQQQNPEGLKKNHSELPLSKSLGSSTNLLRRSKRSVAGNCSTASECGSEWMWLSEGGRDRTCGQELKRLLLYR
jgi:hypothetical protein